MSQVIPTSQLMQLCLFLFALSIFSCKESPQKTLNSGDSETEMVDLLNDYVAMNTDSTINAVIEIPAGTIEKWEVNKENGTLALEYRNGTPRLVQYLPYPCNYGMIPQTILPKQKGGDGDPLDVLILGPQVERESIQQIRLIGMLKLIDTGEQDDKLVGILPNSPFHQIQSIKELEQAFPGTIDILEIWFSNYKGAGVMESSGFTEKQEAMTILFEAMTEYQKMGNSPDK